MSRMRQEGIILATDEREAAPDVVIYCDEAGNSGPNYVDAAQPFYVLAAWAVPFARIANVAAEVELHRQKYANQAAELKSGSLLRNDRTKDGLVNLVHALGRIGCVPFYVVAEKRYCIAGKIIETFADPHDNPRFANAFIPDTTTKREIANSLYERLTDAELNEFAEVYRRPSEEGFRRALDVVVDAVRQRINPELADLLDGCRARLPDIARTEAATTDFGKFFETLNYPVLSSMFMMIEFAARNGLIAPRRFVHDEHRAYEDGFKKLFRVLRSAKERVLELPNGGIQVFPLRHVPQFETARSEHTQAIQAADVLAGAIRHWATLAQAGGPATDADVRVAMTSVPALLVAPVKIAWSIGSNRWVGSLGKLFLDGKPPETTDRHEVAGPTSLLPAVADTRALPAKSHRYRFELPTFGLIGKDSGHLFCASGIDGLQDRGGSAVLLFHSANAAASFLAAADDGRLTEQFTVEQFGPERVDRLTELLRAALTITSTLMGVVDEGQPRCTDLDEFIGGLERSLDRVRRATTSGVIRQIFREHEVDGLRFATMLASDGTYTAMRRPYGPAFSGLSREAALALAVDHAKGQEVTG